VRLDRLKLTNFRQHADTEIDLASGVTGIIGPNGAGKSTLLEAIAWAIYGAPAARGTNETIRFARAAPRSTVRVELDFGLAGHDYRVVRTLTTAEVFLDGDERAVASSIRGATDYLQQRLGMTKDEFFNTYFTGQKELQFLAQMGPAERGRFLAQVLGYERLRLAQERARRRRNDLRHEIDGLRQAMADPSSIRAELESARGQREEAREQVEAARSSLEAARSSLESVAPKWEAIQTSQERASKLEHEREMAAREYRDAKRAVAKAEEELESLSGSEKELAVLRERLEPLESLREEVRALGEAAQRHARREPLAEQVAELETELAQGEKRLGQLGRAPEYVQRFRAELEELKASLDAAETAVEKERDAWQQDRQEVRTRLQTYKDRTAELQQQLDQLREAGPEGTCPTCGRPLHDHYDQVLTDLEDEWESLVQDGKWLKKREGQLEQKPEALTDAERARAELQGRIEDRQEKLNRSENAVEEAEKLAGELERRRATLAEKEKELAEIPSDYDAEAHRAKEERLESLREVERKATRLEEAVSRKPRLEAERTEAAERQQAAEERGGEIREELESLDFDRDRFEALKAEHQDATAAVQKAEVGLTAAKGELERAEDRLAAAKKARSEHDDRKASLDAMESERRLNTELDAAFNQLRVDLNARVRPELSELASAFLTDITAGRYTALEIDESYNVLVLDEGEEKPVISGGEEDIANLVLRLAISQMIAERAGHPLNALILDEVFGGLDVERRDNVIQLLHGLTGRFEQVILITHIESIREGLDTVVRCSFDERSGASVVEQIAPVAA
ncbi:MAG: SMC family ATPase, partial [Longimicrobiales bacterium]|nr:SMC family ATPase [Longimicrobiales bacterium]